MDSIRYFAYGSNMLRERFLARCAEARVIGRASITGYRLTFDKLSRKDGSGKCGYIAHEGDALFGVLWELPGQDLEALDRIEGIGHGYQRGTLLVDAGNLGGVESFVYEPVQTKPGLQPFDWYWALVMAGATQHRLPTEYLSTLRKVTSTHDPHEQRQDRLEALDVLRRAGYAKLLHG